MDFLRRIFRMQPAQIDAAMWAQTLADWPYLQQLPTNQKNRLRDLVAHFLAQKTFHPAGGLHITQPLALAVAAQACVLLLHRPGRAAQALAPWRGCADIVIYPGDVRAQRRVVDAAGVEHAYGEAISGEAAGDAAPLVLSCAAIARAGGHFQAPPPSWGYLGDFDFAATDDYLGGELDNQNGGSHDYSAFNVVIHEFAHQLDMAAPGGANGCPALPVGFLATQSASEARARWAAIWSAAWEDFQEQLAAHQRFAQPAPWLDAYAGEDPAEFFAVACEAYWMRPADLRQAMPALFMALQALFAPPHMEALWR